MGTGPCFCQSRFVSATCLGLLMPRTKGSNQVSEDSEPAFLPRVSDAIVPFIVQTKAVTNRNRCSPYLLVFVVDD